MSTTTTNGARPMTTPRHTDSSYAVIELKEHTFAVALETITPDKAQKYLASNTNNRDIRPRTVAGYARDMKSGEWSVNGEAILFSEDDRLIDGQHRLSAIVKAGVPIVSLVVRGISAPDAQETVDRQAKRTLSDAMRFRGMRNCATYGAAANLILPAIRNGRLTTNADYRPTQKEALAFVERYQDELAAGVVVADRIKKEGGFLIPALAASLYVLMAAEDEADATEFFTMLATGVNLGPGNPILALRRRLIQNRDSGNARNNLSRTFVSAITVKAWNAWRRGETVQTLKWLDSEPFPRLVGLDKFKDSEPAFEDYA